MPGNWGRLYPFDVIFSANDSVFRAEHDPLPRIAYFLSKTRVLRVRKRCSTLKIVGMCKILRFFIGTRERNEQLSRRRRSLVLPGRLVNISVG